MSAFRCLLFILLLALCRLNVSYAQGTSTLSGGTATLAGGATLHTALHWNTSAATFTMDDGTVLFVAEGDQTLTPASGDTFFNLTLDKPFGDLVLAGPITVQGMLRIQQGNLNLNGFTIDLDTTGVLSEPTEYAIVGTAGTITAQRTLVAPTGENVAGLGAILTSSATLGETTITRGHTEQTGGGNASILRYYDITPTTNTGLDATLTFSYREPELNGHPEDFLMLYRSEDSGTSWVEQGGVVDTGANTVTLYGIDAFSRWTLGSLDTPLPVELVSFEALLDGTSALLQWQTASETNNAGFIVQKRSGTENLMQDAASLVWEEVGFVDGHGTTAEAQSYSFMVSALEPGTHRFRLKQIDYDGTFAYSPMVEVVVGVVGRYHLTAAYPNPFNPQTTLSLAVPVTQHVHISVFDVLGRQVTTLWEGEMAANMSRAFVWQAGDKPSGLYFIRVVGERFVETRQVTLLK